MAEEASGDAGQDEQVKWICCGSTDFDPLVPSGLTWCWECRRELWISHTMRPRVDSGELRPCCIDCMSSIVEREKKTPEFRIAPEQKAELDDIGTLPAVTAGVDQLNAALKERAKDDDQRT